MITTLLYVWISGWAVTSGVGAYNCATEPPQRVISQGECYAIAAVGGAVWPAFVYEMVAE